MNPLFHYLRHGAAEDRKPNALFEPAHYRNTCPNPPAHGRDLVAHFLASGPAVSNPHPLFDCAAYPDSRGANPLIHYLRSPSSKLTGEIPAGPAAVAPLEIQDVPLRVACFDSSPPEDGKVCSGAVASVWPDASGAPQWIAQPQQLPFLRSLRLDQIRAQLASGALEP
jgi:hypothetical protein